MKIESALSSLLAAMLICPLVALQAADARMFEGVNLDDCVVFIYHQSIPVRWHLFNYMDPA